MILGRDTNIDHSAVDVQGMRIHHLRAGTGTAILLLHGSGSSAHGMTAVAGLLRDTHQVICPDIPGFGATGPRSDRDYRVQTYAATIREFLGEIGVVRCVVVGNSLGGNIAWNLALDHPELVEALVLINATGYPQKSLPLGLRLMRNPIVGRLLRRGIPRRLVERNLRAAVGTDFAVDDALVDLTHRLWNQDGNAAAFVDVISTDQLDRSSEIPMIEVPTLVLRSASIDGQLFARDIPNSVERIHPSGGHLLPQEDPDWVAGAISDFLGERFHHEGGRP